MGLDNSKAVAHQVSVEPAVSAELARHEREHPNGVSRFEVVGGAWLEHATLGL
jgi:hypothetical protein